jgi:hypothetical protein
MAEHMDRFDITEPEVQEPGLIDGLRFLYKRRVRLAFRCVAILALGLLGFFYFYFTSTKSVEGIVGLSFRGIEKSEYPSGKRFSVEDFRSPNILTKAMSDAGLSSERVPLRDLSAHTYVTPMIPADIQGRWKKQEQSGAKREEFSPNEFKIAIEAPGISDQERIRLFDALINRYQESVKYDQKAAKGFVVAAEYDYDKLAADYDLWDIPDLFREMYRSVMEKLTALVTESTQFQDASYQLSFREVAKDLDNWERTRLQALEALTYQGRLVRNRDFIVQRIQYRIQTLDIQAKQQSQEAAEAIRLLEVIDRPKTLVSGQLAKEGTPSIDVAALDKLLKGDYVGPVVERISKLQTETQEKLEEKDRLEKQLALLPKSSDPSGKIPEGYKELTTTLSKELSGIIQKYDNILDDYLDATITAMVTIKQAPLITRPGYSPLIVIPGIAFMSLFLAIVLLGIEHMFAKARQEEKAAAPVKKQAAGI